MNENQGTRGTNLTVVPPPDGKSKPKTTRAKKPRTTIPDDWELSEHLIAWAREKTAAPGLQWLADQAETFMADARANDRTHSDWDMAFQVWVRKEIKWAQERGRMPSAGRKASGGGAYFPGQGMYS